MKLKRVTIGDLQASFLSSPFFPLSRTLPLIIPLRVLVLKESKSFIRIINA